MATIKVFKLINNEDVLGEVESWDDDVVVLSNPVGIAIVRDPKTGNIKKVNFGDKKMSIKRDNPARRKNFRARHNCAQKKDRTKASYWSCRLPRYAKLLGIKSNFTGFW